MPTRFTSCPTSCTGSATTSLHSGRPSWTCATASSRASLRRCCPPSLRSECSRTPPGRHSAGCPTCCCGDWRRRGAEGSEEDAAPLQQEFVERLLDDLANLIGQVE